jgi:hypothetical protein
MLCLWGAEAALQARLDGDPTPKEFERDVRGGVAPSTL